MGQYPEEWVIFAERFQARTLDFRRQLSLTCYNKRKFVKCAILIDDQTENLAFTRCTLEDLISRDGRVIATAPFLADGNTFKLPIEMRKADLNKRLSQALAGIS